MSPFRTGTGAASCSTPPRRSWTLSRERAGAKKPLRGTDKIALAVGRVIDHYKMAKHFTITITDDGLTFTRNAPQIAAEAALDGVYRAAHQPRARDARCRGDRQGLQVARPR